MKLIHRILDLLFPPRCILCRGILKKEETDFCRDCRMNWPAFPVLPENTHPDRKSSLQFLDSFAAVWYYEGNVRRSILRYKFRNARHYAAGYGRVLAMRLQQEHPEGFDRITWVPISAKRKWKLGYDQSELMANAVGQELNVTTEALLRKIRDNPPQSGMAAEQRKANVLGVYEPICREAAAGKRILLVDDVFTTGSTAEECARVLLTAGAKEVHAAAIAAAQKHEKKPSR